MRQTWTLEAPTGGRSMVASAMEAIPMPVELRSGQNGSSASPALHSSTVGEASVRRPASQAAGTSTRASLGPVELRSPRRVSGPTLAAAAVVVGCAAIALGVWGIVRALASDGSRGGTASATQIASAREVMSLLSKPTTVRIPLRHSGGHIVLAVSSGGRAALVLDGLVAAPAGRTYQAWVVTRGSQEPVSAALFSGTEVGALLATAVAPDATVGVTVERAGGVSAPTRTLRIVATRPAST